MALEFHSFPICDLPAYTWEVCGHRVHSLKFSNCRWNDGTIENIIIHCDRLASFQIIKRTDGLTGIFSECAVGHDARGIEFCSPELLNKLVEKGIRRTALHTFSLIIDSIHLPESELEKIFLIYPSIRRFNTGEPYYYYWSAPRSSPEEMAMLSKPDILLRLNLYKQLESLAFNFPTNGDWMKTHAGFLNQDLRLSRLKQFETTLASNTISEKEIFSNFFVFQENLNAVCLTLAECSIEFAKNITFHILENCPNLREFRKFHFDDHGVLFLEHTEIPRFVKLISKLHVLDLNFDIRESESSPSESSPSESSPSGYEILFPKKLSLNLSTLIISHEIDENFCATLLKNCPLLKHLQLKSFSDYILQIIFQYLINLRTLILSDPNLAKCTDYGFTGKDASNGNDEGYSIMRLRELKRLDLGEIPFRKITENFLLEFQLPRLEYLKFALDELFEKLSEDALTCLASNVPELRIFSIDAIDPEAITKKSIEFCKGLKNLHCLELHQISDSFELHDEQVQKIFDVCPSLKYIIQDIHEVPIAYFFNPFSKEIRKIVNSPVVDDIKISLKLPYLY